MRTNKIEIQPRLIDAETGAIDVIGDLTGFAEQQMALAFDQLAERGARKILFVFDRMDFMNSSGIGLLITFLVRANRKGIQLAAAGLKDHFQHLFELTRLKDPIPVYPDEAAALAAWAAAQA